MSIFRSLFAGAVKADFRDLTIMYRHFLVGQREILEQKTPEMNELGSPLSNACLTFKIGSVVLKLQSFKVDNKNHQTPDFIEALQRGLSPNCPDQPITL